MEIGKMEKFISYEPRAVACHRGKSFDSEVSWLGDHYVIMTGRASREYAMAIAEEVVTEIKDKLNNICHKELTLKYKIAKP